jgi:hypothetical protein
MLKTTEVEPITIHPEDILISSEAEILQLAYREELSCPRCGLALQGFKRIEPWIYEGVVLVCLGGCSWRGRFQIEIQKPF